jgi:hypothetical protein
MSTELLEKVSKLRETEVYALVRDDGQVASVTKDIENIPRMISEEYCGVGVELVNLIYNKQPMNWTLEVNLDDDGDINEYEFTIATVIIY